MFSYTNIVARRRQQADVVTTAPDERGPSLGFHQRLDTVERVGNHHGGVKTICSEHLHRLPRTLHRIFPQKQLHVPTHQPGDVRPRQELLEGEEALHEVRVGRGRQPRVPQQQLRRRLRVAQQQAADGRDARLQHRDHLLRLPPVLRCGSADLASRGHRLLPELTARVLCDEVGCGLGGGPRGALVTGALVANQRPRTQIISST
eukprot:CAMPEP_0118928066 /NCGR_PEP_ID=MMETSP1169-20130426/5406_1 /TAXON_ID=36882 /ORGANISM="Pyramimonas obovata, Strain CCMP722" /LENGTH=203 /DNA_ID=CAMNT_0006869963 /DNA_START=194 /DNA_END=806 /DNA_ORIENTATION=-